MRVQGNNTLVVGCLLLIKDGKEEVVSKISQFTQPITSQLNTRLQFDFGNFPLQGTCTLRLSSWHSFSNSSLQCHSGSKTEKDKPEDQSVCLCWNKPTGEAGEALALGWICCNVSSVQQRFGPGNVKEAVLIFTDYTPLLHRPAEQFAASYSRPGSPQPTGLPQPRPL